MLSPLSRWYTLAVKILGVHFLLRYIILDVNIQKTTNDIWIKVARTERVRVRVRVCCTSPALTATNVSLLRFSTQLSRLPYTEQ
jgi:hypothetical protein